MKLEELLIIPKQSRAFVVGDLAGNYDILINKLSSVGYEPDTDYLIGVGDWIDKGEDSVKLINLSNNERVITVMGNHEASILIEGDIALSKMANSKNRDWYRNLNEYEKNDIQDSIKNMPLVLYIQHGEFRYTVSHAAPSIAAESTSDILFGISDVSRLSTEDENYNLSFHGHIPTQEPMLLGNHLWIDTVGKTGKLTAVELNQNGATTHF